MKRNKIRQLLAQASKEVKKYRKTKRVNHLLQAAEKVWVSFILLLEILTGRELRNYPQIKRVKGTLLKQGLIPQILYERAYFLHIYHYEGWADPSEIIRLIKYCSIEIRRRIKNEKK